MTRGGPPQEVADVLARARERAGVREAPALDASTAPPASAPSDDRKGEVPSPAPRHDGTFCKSCSARILWAQLLDEKGERQRKPDGRFKAIPVDFDPVPNGNVILLHRTGQGIVCIVLRKGEIPAAGVRLRVSHFATCPAAAKHRRTR